MRGGVEVGCPFVQKMGEKIVIQIYLLPYFKFFKFDIIYSQINDHTR